MQTGSEGAANGRRSFLGKITLGAFAAAFLGQGWTYLRALVPNIKYEPPKKFKVGSPVEFAEGINFIESKGLFIIREGSQYSSISAKCTHLGCTVKYAPLQHAQTVKVGGREITEKYEFHCPCHGSKFRQNGMPYSGPAPSSLPWHKLEIAPEDGQLVVDISTSVDSDFRITI